MPVLENYYEHLYHNPVVSLRGYCAHHRLQGSILAYLDFGGATGSAKDGLAEGMLALAAEQGLLAKGQPIVEASSGTFAVALTIAARHSGHPVTLTMPEGVPDERKKLLRSLGAQLAFPARWTAAAVPNGWPGSWPKRKTATTPTILPTT